MERGRQSCPIRESPFDPLTGFPEIQTYWPSVLDADGQTVCLHGNSINVPGELIKIGAPPRTATIDVPFRPNAVCGYIHVYIYIYARTLYILCVWLRAHTLIDCFHR